MVKRRNLRKFWKLGLPEYATGHFDINKDSELVVREGNYQYNVKDLCDRFGTSLELVFPHIIEERLNAVFNAFKSTFRSTHYKGKFYFHYPMKANQNKEFVLPIVSEGGHLETSSANELWVVKRMWEQEQFSTKIRVLCNGPKTNRYLSLIEELKLKNLDIVPVIENHWELEYLRNNYRGDVGIRMDPGMKVQSHWDKKAVQFGFSAQELMAIGKIRNLKILSYHIGKQTTRQSDHIQVVRKAMELFVRMKKLNPQLDVINIGGGFAVPFEKNRKLYTVESVVRCVVRTVRSIVEKAHSPHPDIVVEWGSYLVAPAQISIFKVIAEKSMASAAAKRWYFLDGSFMNDLLDTWAIRQKWHVVPVNNMDANKFSRVWLSGSSCDSDDRYTNGGEYILLPRIEDLNGEPQYIAFFDTGAYQDALASHHCMLSSPAKLVIQNGVITVARKRETAEEVGKQFGW